MREGKEWKLQGRVAKIRFFSFFLFFKAERTSGSFFFFFYIFIWKTEEVVSESLRWPRDVLAGRCLKGEERDREREEEKRGNRVTKEDRHAQDLCRRLLFFFSFLCFLLLTCWFTFLFFPFFSGLCYGCRVLERDWIFILFFYLFFLYSIFICDSFFSFLTRLHLYF